MQENSKDISQLIQNEEEEDVVDDIDDQELAYDLDFDKDQIKKVHWEQKKDPFKDVIKNIKTH